MIVWGGGIQYADGALLAVNHGRYNPTTDTWTTLNSENGPAPRASHSVVWTGSEIIVWGGYTGADFYDDGGRYDPSIDAWATTNVENAPRLRNNHSAVWTGEKMLIWGGSNFGGDRNDGAAYY